MPTFKLSLTIDTSDLRAIRAAQERIILAKPVSAGIPNVTWQAFEPFEGNEVTWDESYGIYASQTQIVNGANLFQMSATPYPSMDQVTYPFGADATFGDPQSGGVPEGSFATKNNYTGEQSLTFGLYQAATVNNVLSKRPVNAATVLANRDLTFTPFTTVFIWLQANLVSRTVVTKITAPTVTVKFGGTVTDITLKYSPKTGLFTPTTSNGELTEAPSVGMLYEAVT